MTTMAQSPYLILRAKFAGVMAFSYGHESFETMMACESWSELEQLAALFPDQ